MYKSSFELKLPKQLLITAALVLTVVSIPIILSPPDFMIKNRYNNDLSGQLNIQNITVIDSISNSPVDLQHGKWIVGFYSTGCKFCKMANRKLEVISEKHDIDNVFVFFWGDPAKIDDFWLESNSDGNPFMMLETKQFFFFFGKSLPSVFFIEDMQIKKHCLYRDLFEEDVVNFFKE